VTDPLRRRLLAVHRALDACSGCSKMIGPVVHGPPVVSGIFLLGQAPGPHEGKIGRPFAWTAGKTLFRWFEESIGCSEEAFRERVYMAAVARCFPGKAPGGGDRRPDDEEIARCRGFVHQEVTILAPRLVLPVGTLAIEQVLGLPKNHKQKLADVVGQSLRVTYEGIETDVIPLPHPSGASTWHRMEPGKTLLGKALRLVAEHPETKRTFAV
jgi:uracil-DNA glycosylase